MFERMMTVLLLGGVCLSSTPPAAVPKEPLQCKREVLRSYMLKGRQKASEAAVHVCPGVKSSCCTRTDQQKMYHIVNDIVPGRVLEYQSKMKLALGKLKGLHAAVTRRPPAFSGSRRRREFCAKQAQKVSNFPFNVFYNKALEELELVRSEMNEYYQSFFCVICDAENHQFFNLAAKVPNVMLRGEFCKEMLKSNQEIIKLFNVELVEYLVSLQHLVDCNHYAKSYNLKFFDEKRERLSGEISECLNNIESANFLKSCQSTCQQLKISKIVDLIEGDFEFLIDAVNLFEKFFELKESGHLVSMKLRKFFSKFVVPRKLKSKSPRKLLALQGPESKSKSTAKALEKHEASPKKSEKKKPDSPVRKLKLATVTAKASHSPPRHNSRGIFHASAAAPTRKPSPKASLQPGRTLSDTPAAPKPKRTAKLVFNRDLSTFYDEITVQGPEKSSLVYRVSDPPVDLDSIEKVFGLGVGISPLDVKTRFSLPQDVFYKLLFSYRKPDVPDTNLMFFLVDFNAKNHDALKSDLSTEFVIDLEAKDKKEEDKAKDSKPKGKRILEQNRGPL